MEWFLEGYLDGTKLWKVPIREFPFRVGRGPLMNLQLPAAAVSQEHAVFFNQEDRLGLRDLDSTNGTFVNRQRLAEPAMLEEGDIVHFAMVEFRVGREMRMQAALQTMAAGLDTADLPQQMVVGTRQFQQMVAEEQVTALFQKICRLADGSVFGYELLGRGAFDGLPQSPGELFRIAASLGMEVELSEMFRRIGVAAARSLRGEPKLFVNTHPVENDPERLLAALAELRTSAPQVPLIVEIHEAAVTQIAQMRDLRRALADQGIGLAYDDFGAGQARLIELVEVPPDVLKFDMSLVRGIDTAPATRQQLLETLVHMARDLGIACLAEGVELPAEAELCRQMGFEFVQGYLYGRPVPIADL